MAVGLSSASVASAMAAEDQESFFDQFTGIASAVASAFGDFQPPAPAADGSANTGNSELAIAANDFLDVDPMNFFTSLFPSELPAAPMVPVPQVSPVTIDGPAVSIASSSSPRVVPDYLGQMGAFGDFMGSIPVTIGNDNAANPNAVAAATRNPLDGGVMDVFASVFGDPTPVDPQPTLSHPEPGSVVEPVSIGGSVVLPNGPINFSIIYE